MSFCLSYHNLTESPTLSSKRSCMKVKISCSSVYSQIGFCFVTTRSFVDFGLAVYSLSIIYRSILFLFFNEDSTIDISINKSSWFEENMLRSIASIYVSSCLIYHCLNHLITLIPKNQLHERQFVSVSKSVLKHFLFWYQPMFCWLFFNLVGVHYCPCSCLKTQEPLILFKYHISLGGKTNILYLILIIPVSIVFQNFIVLYIKYVYLLSLHRLHWPILYFILIYFVRFLTIQLPTSVEG